MDFSPAENALHSLLNTISKWAGWLQSDHRDFDLDRCTTGTEAGPEGRRMWRAHASSRLELKQPITTHITISTLLRSIVLASALRFPAIDQILSTLERVDMASNLQQHVDQAYIPQSDPTKTSASQRNLASVIGFPASSRRSGKSFTGSSETSGGPRLLERWIPH